MATIPGIRSWTTYAGGTSAAPGKHSYSFRAGKYEYHVDPVSWPSGRHRGYVAKVTPGGRGLWEWLGRNAEGRGHPWHFFRSPQVAAKACRDHFEAMRG